MIFNFVVDRAYAPGRGRRLRFTKEWIAYVDDLTVRSGRVIDGRFYTDSEADQAIRDACSKGSVATPRAAALEALGVRQQGTPGKRAKHDAAKADTNQSHAGLRFPCWVWAVWVWSGFRACRGSWAGHLSGRRSWVWRRARIVRTRVHVQGFLSGAVRCSRSGQPEKALGSSLFARSRSHVSSVLGGRAAEPGAGIPQPLWMGRPPSVSLDHRDPARARSRVHRPHPGVDTHLGERGRPLLSRRSGGRAYGDRCSPAVLRMWGLEAGSQQRQDLGLVFKLGASARSSPLLPCLRPAASRAVRSRVAQVLSSTLRAERSWGVLVRRAAPSS